jgi:hypothetical protein
MTDYEASAVYGLFVEADLIQTMLDKIPAKTHEEKLYDQRTGAFIKMETVIDVAEHSALVVDGVEYGDASEEGVDQGLEDIAFSVTKTQHIYAHPFNDKWGGLVGYVVGFKFDDMDGKTIAKKIAIFDKFAPKLAAAINKRLKGKSIKINPDGHSAPSSDKVPTKAKMYGVLIVD